MRLLLFTSEYVHDGLEAAHRSARSRMRHLHTWVHVDLAEGARSVVDRLGPPQQNVSMAWGQSSASASSNGTSVRSTEYYRVRRAEQPRQLVDHVGMRAMYTPRLT